jgi:hypothetical protein
MWLEEGTPWVREQAKAALPILLGRVQLPEPQIYYTDLSLTVAKRLAQPPVKFIRAYHMVARRIDELLNRLSDTWTHGEIPPLGVLVVRKQDDLPGPVFDPFLARYLAKSNHAPFTKQTRKGATKLATQAVQRYVHWDKVAESFNV